ncbi:hypothetical protein L6259_01495 [Candidatus Parcubacteria bacterium]|nr:hypothetical protein [Patescibacteria group bacterium]MCG2693939.1 hypothetical protein [Candidatus Parcubacteria bacterium]
MLPAMYISDWNDFYLSQIAEEKNLSVIYRDTDEVPRPLAYQRVRLILVNKEGRMEFVIGEAEVLNHMVLPIGQIFPHMWATNIGDRDMETFMDKNRLSRFSFVSYVSLKLKDLNSEFSLWLNER